MAIINGRGRVGIRRPSAAAAPSIVLDGLKLYLDASKTTSYPGTGTVWTDISGNGNNGTLNGAIFNGGNGGNIQFDGINDSVIIPNNLTFTTSMTIDICFRSIKSARHHIICFGNTGATNNTLNFDINDGGYTLWIYWNGGGTNAIKYTSPSLSNGAIRNLTFVHNNNVNTVYINGSVLTGGSVVGTQTFTSISGNIYLGSGDSGVYTQGNIYNFKVYDRALSAAEVLQNYNALKNRYI